MNVVIKSTRTQAPHDLHNVLRMAIISLRFAPGQLLSENELAERYGTSRTPIRQALKSLEREGLVRVSSRRKTMVAPLDLDAYRQAVFGREVLEVAAAREAARHFKHQDRCLSAIVTEQNKALEQGDVRHFDELDFQFHREVFTIARLEQLVPVVTSFRGLTDRMRVAHLSVLAQYDRFGVIAQHATVAEAIESGKAHLAGAAMSSHVVSVFTRVAQLARERPDFFGGVTEEAVTQLEDYLAMQAGKSPRDRL